MGKTFTSRITIYDRNGSKVMTHLVKKSFRRVIATKSVLYCTGYPERHFPAGQRPQPDSERNHRFVRHYAK